MNAYGPGDAKYTVAEVDALITKAKDHLDQLREMLAEIGTRLGALTDQGDPR